MSINKNVCQIRKRLGYSQEDVANKLGISRQTYMKMENEGQITTDQLETLAAYFGVPVTEFYYEIQDTDKFKQMYLYILSKFDTAGVPKTKLAKLLYLVDFRHFYEKFESMSGVQYKCKEYGPLADPFLEMTDDMFSNGEITIEPLSGGANMIRISKKNIPIFDKLSNAEKIEMDEIYEAWKDANTNEIVKFTHDQKPWMSCRKGEIIPYELILQEEPDHVY